MVLNFCCVVMLILRVILEVKIKEKITRVAIADIIITLFFLVGMVYEAIIADDLH